MVSLLETLIDAPDEKGLEAIAWASSAGSCNDPPRG
jgi:hypothetical protein